MKALGHLDMNGGRACALKVSGLAGVDASISSLVSSTYKVLAASCWAWLSQCILLDHSLT